VALQLLVLGGSSAKMLFPVFGLMISIPRFWRGLGWTGAAIGIAYITNA
jgi:hypothetical protein